MSSPARRVSVVASLLILVSAGGAYAAQPPSTGSSGGSALPPAAVQGESALDPELPPDVIASSFASDSTWQPENAV